MYEFKVFRNFKQRGEWVELRFMAEALRHGYKVLKPWGDSQPFDVALNFGPRIVRVQVKSTSCRAGTGYFCPVQAQLLQRPVHARSTRLLCRLCHHAGHLVPHPRPRPSRRRRPQTRPHALPHAAPKEKSLQLRILSRSLAPPPPGPEKEQSEEKDKHKRKDRSLASKGHPRARPSRDR